MSTMIERVAAALWHSRSAGKWEDAAPLARNYTMEDARAAIEAMRDVDGGSPAILKDGMQSLYSCSSDPELEDARGCWEAMIDAALKETA